MKRILSILAVLLGTSAIVASGQPVPNMPSNGAVDQPINVTLGWRPLKDVVEYEAQLSLTSAFDDYEMMITAESSVEAANLLYQTLYYWRVRALDDQGEPSTDWSGVQTFTTKAGTGIPQPILPEDGVVDQPRTIQLEWTGVPGVGGYDVEYAFDPSFLGGVTVSASGTTYLLSGLDYEQQVFWHVRTSSAASAPGEWSRWASFTTEYRAPDPLDAPRLLSPANGAVAQPHTLTLIWNPVSGKEILYDVEVALDDAFTELAFSASELDSTTFDLSALESDRTYYWHARAFNSETKSDWSSTFRFSTVIDPPSGPLAPQLLTPLNGSSLVPTTTLLTWDSVEDATWYEVEFGRDPSFGERDTLITTSDASAEMAGLTQETTYHWRARAGNENGPSGWSRPFRFTTAPEEPTLPEVPRLIAPAKGAVDVEPPTEFLWLPAVNATDYAVQLSTTGDFQGEEITVDAIDTTTILQELAPGTHYFWRAQGRNSFGEGEWSETWNFTTAGSSSVREKENAANAVRIYPVPASENLSIELAIGGESATISLFDVKGGERLTQTYSEEEIASGRIVLSLREIPAGIWFCRIVLGDTVLTRSIIVVK